MVLEIVIILIALMLVVGILLLVSTFLITSTSSSTTGTTGTNLHTSPPMVWSENIRNMKNYMTFPPCYDLDVNAKKIYSILDRNNLIQRYQNFLDVLSVVLCIEKKQNDSCQLYQPLDLKDRFTQIIGMGGDTSDKKSKEIASAFIPIEDTLKSKFLVGAVNLLEKNVSTILKDNDIPTTDKEQISGYLYSFYAMHLSIIYKQC